MFLTVTISEDLTIYLQATSMPLSDDVLLRCRGPVRKGKATAKRYIVR